MLDERNKDESIAHLKFLWGSYESRYYWWEVVEMARKLVLTGLLVIFLEGSVLQLCTGLVVTVVSLVIYANICPYGHASFKTTPIISTVAEASISEQANVHPKNTRIIPRLPEKAQSASSVHSST